MTSTIVSAGAACCTTTASRADPDDLRLPLPDVAVDAAARDATVIHPGAAAPRAAVAGRAVGGRRPRRGAPGPTGPDHRFARRAGSSPPRWRSVPVSVPSCVLAGRTDAVALVGLIGAAGRVVCGDTGVAHVASATATPSVVLFGPTPPALWGPPAQGPHVAIWHGRRGDPHGDSLDPSLAAITVEEVLDAIGRLPERASCQPYAADIVQAFTPRGGVNRPTRWDPEHMEPRRRTR